MDIALEVIIRNRRGDLMLLGLPMIQAGVALDAQRDTARVAYDRLVVLMPLAFWGRRIDVLWAANGEPAGFAFFVVAELPFPLPGVVHETVLWQACALTPWAILPFLHVAFDECIEIEVGKPFTFERVYIRPLETFHHVPHVLQGMVLDRSCVFVGTARVAELELMMAEAANVCVPFPADEAHVAMYITISHTRVKHGQGAPIKRGADVGHFWRGLCLATHCFFQIVEVGLMIFVHARVAAALLEEPSMLFAQVRKKIIFGWSSPLAGLRLDPRTAFHWAMSVRELDVPIEELAIAQCSLTRRVAEVSWEMRLIA